MAIDLTGEIEFREIQRTIRVVVVYYNIRRLRGVDTWEESELVWK